MASGKYIFSQAPVVGVNPSLSTLPWRVSFDGDHIFVVDEIEMARITKSGLLLFGGTSEEHARVVICLRSGHLKKLVEIGATPKSFWDAVSAMFPHSSFGKKGGEAKKAEGACTCSMQIVLGKGCQCGGK